MNGSNEREEAVFEAALQLQGTARGAYLNEACSDDPALRARIEGLLGALDRAGHLLSEPAVARDGATPVLAVPPDAQPGDRIGRYKLLQPIGEGGCGVVYMAEQEEPVRRRVALKVIKLGMDTKSVIARFEAERQALALMDHPNIAKVLDAGATDTGRPYFVMELVRGVRLTDYCDENNLAMPQRLELFIQVCQAIQHAHQKGIIHRDIKPSNILVTVNDGVPVPKVIDFGIAKATTGQQLTDKTLFTAFEQFIGTPAYMSPEQAVMTSLDIDTRSDIYSLGVLLYELLTGKTPFDGKELLQAGFDEMRRTIREKEPARPSTRLSTMVEGDLSTTARRRHIEAPKLIHLVQGDLDWIVMKCLEKDRGRRYETAYGLAMDLRRHLENEPVLASPPGAFYRLQKLVRRNKLAVVAISAVFLALLIGLGISLWQFVEKTKALRQVVAAEAEQSRLRKEAEGAAKKSDEIARFLEDMLKGVEPSVARGRDTTVLKEILDETLSRLATDLKTQPEVEAHLRVTIGEIYRAIGQYKQAEIMQREALAIVNRELGGRNEPRAATLNNLGMALWSQNSMPEAETHLRAALAIYRNMGTNQAESISICLNNLALALRDQEKFAEAELVQLEGLELIRRLYGTSDIRLGVWLSNLGVLYRARGQVAKAEAAQREALSVLRNIAPNDLTVLTTMNCLAEVLRDRGKHAEAESLVRETLPMQRKVYGDKHLGVARSIYTLATLLYLQNKLPEAEDAYREALAMQQKLLGKDDQGALQILNDLAGAVRKQGRLAEAKGMYEEALELLRGKVGNSHRYVTHSLLGLAQVCAAEGRHIEGEALQREALEILKSLLGQQHPGVAATLNDLALSLAAQGKLVEAETTQREALAMQKALLGDEHPHVLRSLDNLTSQLLKQRKRTEAAAVMLEALPLRRKLMGDIDPKVVNSLASLATALLGDGQFVEAESLARECLTCREKQSPEDWRTFNTRSLLGGCLLGQKKFTEAEPLLVSGYEGMELRGEKIPPASRLRLGESLQRLIQLYKAIDRPDLAAGWQKKFEEFEKAEAGKKVRPQP